MFAALQSSCPYGTMEKKISEVLAMYMAMDDSFFADPFMIAFIVIYGVFMLITIAAGITMYILQSVGMYTIAKRRGIHHPGLAWVPVANMWILGSISDQYRYVVKRKIRNRRKVLLGLLIATYVLLLAFAGVMVASIISGTFEVPGPAQFYAAFGMSGAMLVYLAAWVISVIATVFMYLAYYDLFASCNPSNAVLFLVLGIFFNFLLPVFIFVCRKKDEGMPPRRIQVPVAPWTSVQTGVPVNEKPVAEVPAQNEMPVAEETIEQMPTEDSIEE